MDREVRKRLKEKQRIVIKIGSSSLTHACTGDLNLMKIEKLVRVISDLKGEGKEVVLVSSGAIAAGRQALGRRTNPVTISEKQAFAAVGQARLMMVYQKLFAEYNQTCLLYTSYGGGCHGGAVWRRGGGAGARRTAREEASLNGKWKM